ncbi:MAG: ATP-binding cassette domain-containing protein [Actinomycetota bacterium]|jgi:ABC-2 type transport system ATP-binding protein|nr:ATP-binding cassette domain-containing protein [Actinomycetota bacterium]
MNQTGGYAIQTSALTKEYEAGVRAVDSLDLKVESNTVFALLGPNGAGKTTTVSMLTTLLPPTSGTAFVAGSDILEDPAGVRRKIGVTFQETVLDDALTGRQALDHHGQLYGLSRAERRERAGELLGLAELEDAADKQIKKYSGGMKRRLELIRGLMTDPEILFLDEPTLGVDPQNRAKIGDHILGLKQRKGMTVLLTTHDLDEAARLADTVGIVDEGRLVVVGSPADLIAQMGDDTMHVQGNAPSDGFASAAAALDFVTEVAATDSGVQLGVDSGDRRLTEVVRLASESGYPIETISVSKPTLGDVFLKYTGRELRD